MKTIYLVRHAKSSRKYPALEDFERPLNKRGRESLIIMGKMLNNINVSPGIVISSPASRAAMTARGISSMIDYPLDKIEYKEAVYLSDEHTLIDVIENIKSSVKSAMLVGHNPGLTDLANYLSDQKIQNIPTCGVFCMDFNIRSWRDISASSGRLKFFEFPKKQ